MEVEVLKDKADSIRIKVFEYHLIKKCGGLGSSLSCVEILTALYYYIIKKNDKFILSKGHASSILYVILNDLKKIPNDVFLTLEEHPTINKKYGIEATTGSLGQGLSIGLGMSIANKNINVYVLLGDLTFTGYVTYFYSGSYFYSRSTYFTLVYFLLCS